MVVLDAGLRRGLYGLSVWRRQVSDFETWAGARLAGVPGVVEAARRTLERLWEVLALDYRASHDPEPSWDVARQKAAEAFFLDLPESAGQVGDFATMEYLLSGEANLREIMTAIFNAAYFRSHVCSYMPGFEDISLKSMVQSLYFNEAPDGAEARSRGLNHDFLLAYTSCVMRDPELLRRRAEAPLGAQEGIAEDVFAFACQAFYRGERAFREASDSSFARRYLPVDTSPGGVSSGDRYERLGIGLSGREAEYQDYMRSTSLSLSDFKVQFYPLGSGVVINEWSEGILVSHTKAYGWGPDGKRRQVGWYSVSSRYVSNEIVRRGDTLGVLDPDTALKWREGYTCWGIKTDSAWYRAVALDRGFPVIAGISPTAARMMSVFGWITPPGVRARDFLRAVIAWMLPLGDHSLYEILRGADIAMLTDANGAEAVLGPPGSSTLHKRCLISDVQERLWLGKLIRELARPGGAYEAYPDIVALLFEDSGLTGEPGLQPPTLDAVYEEMLRTIRPEEVREPELVWECLKAFTDWHTMPPVSSYPHWENGKEKTFIFDRMNHMFDWLQVVRVNGSDLAQSMSLPRVTAIYMYTSGRFQAILQAFNAWDEDKFREGMWNLAVSNVEGRLIGEGAGYVNYIPAFAEGLVATEHKYGIARQAWLKNKESATAASEIAYREALGNLKAAFYQDVTWDELYMQMRLHGLVALEALEAIPAYTGTVFRGSVCEYKAPAGPPAGGEIADPFKAYALTSTTAGRDKAEAVFYAKIFAGKEGRLPVLAEYALSGAGAGKAIWGLADLPDQKEVLIVRGSRAVRTSGPTVVDPGPGDVPDFQHVRVGYAESAPVPPEGLRVVSLTPSAGPPTGGASFTLGGAGFVAGTEVTFAGHPATGVRVMGGGTRLDGLTPPGAGGTAKVTVTTPAGNADAPYPYAYQSRALPPDPLTIEPGAGPPAGGTPFTITGARLNGATVTIGGTPAEVTGSSDVLISGIVPPGQTGRADILVTTTAGTASPPVRYRYEAVGGAPSITRLTPETGWATDTFTIEGANLWDDGIRVRFGATCPQWVLVNSEFTRLMGEIPPGSGQVIVTATSGAGSAAAPHPFTYVLAAPTADRITPATGSAAGGDRFVIGGNNLFPDAVVTIGGAPAVIKRTLGTLNNYLVGYTPPGTPGPAEVTVTTAGGTVTLTGKYTYTR